MPIVAHLHKSQSCEGPGFLDALAHSVKSINMKHINIEIDQQVMHQLEIHQLEIHQLEIHQQL